MSTIRSPLPTSQKPAPPQALLVVVVRVVVKCS